jgi:hypothetical protein
MITKHRKASRAKRQARTLDYDLISKVLDNVGRLTPSEVAQAITPMRAAMLALKRRTATELDWMWLVTCAQVGMSIERQGVVRGLAQHLQDALDVCSTIADRAHTSGQWCSPCLRGDEIETLDTAIDLHEYQLQQLSYGEYTQACERARKHVSSTGGQVVHVEGLHG